MHVKYFYRWNVIVRIERLGKETSERLGKETDFTARLLIFMISPMYGRRSSTTGHYAIFPLCTHTLGDTSFCPVTFGIAPSFVIQNSEVLMIAMVCCTTASEENSHPIYIQMNHKTSATFVYLVTRKSFTFHLLNAHSHDNWNIWHVVSHNTVVYLWNIPSIVAVWQRKQYAFVAPKSSDLEGHRLVLSLIEGLGG